MKHHYHVRHVRDGWTWMRQNRAQAFWYDLCHHGLGVAIYNLRVLSRC